MLGLKPTASLLQRLTSIAARPEDPCAAAVGEFLQQRSAAMRDQCDELDPPSASTGEPPLWRHQVVPIAVVRSAAAAERMSTRQFLREVGEAHPENEVASFSVAAPVKPENPHRRTMRARLKRIDAAVETALYNEMLAGDASGGHTTGGPAAGNRGTMAGMTLDATRLGGGRLLLGGAMRDAQRGAEDRAQPETFSVIMKDVGIGLDVRLMSLAGGIVGYYLAFSRGLSTEQCIVGAAVGAVAMLFVDAALLMIRMAREDGNKAASPRKLFGARKGASQQPPATAEQLRLSASASTDAHAKKE